MIDKPCIIIRNVLNYILDQNRTIMKFFKHLSLTLLLLSCNLNSGDEEEEFYFYEPVFDDAFQVVTDPDYRVDYEYQIQKDLVVETEDSSGYKYKLEIPAFALTPGSYTSFSGFIMPLTGIQNLPTGIEFKFGIEIEPFGMTFSKPVKITIELPGDFNTEDLMGFYSPGEWETTYLEPVKIKRSSGKTEAIFNITHFSSYGGITVEDDMIDCPDHRSTQNCKDVKEVIACKLGHYEEGGMEELTEEDRKDINDILRNYMDRQLRYLEEEPPEFYELYQFQEDLKEYLCWTALTQEFNGNPESVFGDLYNRAESIIKDVLGFFAQDLDSTCVQNRKDSECVQGKGWYEIQTYMQWLTIAQQLGLDQELEMKDIYEFCDNAVNELLYNLKLIDPINLTEYYHPYGDEVWFKNYQIEFSSPDDVFSFMHIMENALGQPMEIEEADIEWIEDSNVAAWVKNAFIYENGELWLNKNQEYVNESLGCDPIVESCVTYYHSGFSLMRNDCIVAYVDVFWDIR